MRSLTLIACVALLGCGDPLVEGDYRGQPLIEISGTIRVEDSLTSAQAAAVRVGLLWVGAAQQGDLTQGRSESSFPARYSMKVFARPPTRAMRTLPDRGGLQGTARIVLYIDENGDDQLDSLERIVGAAPNQVLAYFTSSEPTTLVRGSLRTGYQVMELFACDDRLVDKATYEPAGSEQAVDLTLAAGVASGLLDIDCDTVADDLCYDLRLQVQEDPDNTELVALYEQRCDVRFEPEFNNTDATPTEEPKPDEELPPDDRTFCDENPDKPECRDPDGQPSAATVIAECKPLLSGAIGAPYEAQREAYWRFRQCTEEFDPCHDLGWLGGNEGWMPYQMCTFEALPPHHEQWCRDIAERIDATAGDDREFLASEFERAACADAI